MLVSKKCLWDSQTCLMHYWSQPKLNFQRCYPYIYIYAYDVHFESTWYWYLFQNEFQITAVKVQIFLLILCVTLNALLVLQFF